MELQWEGDGGKMHKLHQMRMTRQNGHDPQHFALSINVTCVPPFPLMTGGVEAVHKLKSPDDTQDQHSFHNLVKNPLG